MTKRDERVAPIRPETAGERSLVSLQRRHEEHAAKAADLLAERNRRLVEMNAAGVTHRRLAGLLSYGAEAAGSASEPLTISCVGRAVRRRRPPGSLDGRTVEARKVRA